MTSSTASQIVQVPQITESEVREFIAAKQAFDQLAGQLRAAEEAYRSTESRLIELLEQGHAVEGPIGLVITKIERRNVPWKSIFSQELGADRAVEIFKTWPLSVTKKLKVK